MIELSYSLPLFKIAISCAIVGATMLLAGLAYWIRSTYPPSEEGETRQ